jgi:hypothetical protein
LIFKGKKFGRKLYAVKNHGQKGRGDSLGVIAQPSRQYERLRYTNRPYLLSMSVEFIFSPTVKPTPPEPIKPDFLVSLNELCA